MNGVAMNRPILRIGFRLDFIQIQIDEIETRIIYFRDATIRVSDKANAYNRYNDSLHGIWVIVIGYIYSLSAFASSCCSSSIGIRTNR